MIVQGWEGLVPTFLRDLNDGDIEEVERFLLILFRRKICTFQEEKVLLKNAKADGFVVVKRKITL